MSRRSHNCADAAPAERTCGDAPRLASSHLRMARPSRNLIAALCLSVSAGCSVMPRELNLTPLWFHRMDAAGNVLEWDAAWPLLHYEHGRGEGLQQRQ